MNIGCVVYAEYQGKIIAIECAKGRGTILPGGKWEPPETFLECARRELYEETGLICGPLELIFSGVSEEGFYTYTFIAKVSVMRPADSKEGKVVLSTWNDLKQSKFRGYYELLEQTIAKVPRKDYLYCHW